MITFEHVGIAAKDTRALAEWYVRVLGFKVVYDNKKQPIPTLFVQDAKGMAVEILPPPADGQVQDSRATHFALWVDDFDAAKKELEAKGVVLEPEMSSPSFGGTRIAFFSDPEGHRIQIIRRKQRM